MRRTQILKKTEETSKKVGDFSPIFVAFLKNLNVTACRTEIELLGEHKFSGTSTSKVHPQ